MSRLRLRSGSVVVLHRHRRAVEGAPLVGLGGAIGEVLHRQVLERRLHVLGENVGRIGRARDLVVLAPGRNRFLRTVLTGLVEGDGGGDLRGVADELGGLVIAGGSRLGGDRPPQRPGGVPRAGIDDLLHGVGGVRHDAVVEDLIAVGGGRVGHRPRIVGHRGDDVGVAPRPLGGEGRVGRGDVEGVR